MCNVVTSEQKDNLEHAGPTFFSHCQRQPAHRNGAGTQALGTWRASSPWIHLIYYPCKELQTDVSPGPALGLVLCFQLFALREVDNLLILTWLLA